MKKLIVVIIFIGFAFGVVAWASASHVNRSRDEGDQHADQMRQGNDEDIKRAQGDGAGRRDIQNQGSLQNDDRGRW